MIVTQANWTLEVIVCVCHSVCATVPVCVCCVCVSSLLGVAEK